jgi:hypothetical protein
MFHVMCPDPVKPIRLPRRIHCCPNCAEKRFLDGRKPLISKGSRAGPGPGLPSWPDAVQIAGVGRPDAQRPENAGKSLPVAAVYEGYDFLLPAR